MRSILFILFSTLFISLAIPAPAISAEPGGPIVVLKLDDMVNQNGDIPLRWKAVIDHLQKEKIKFSIGIICNSLETNAPTYLSALTELAQSGSVELWNHGYDHNRWDENGTLFFEYKGPGEEQQHEHFKKSQDLAKEKLGVELVTFGAPFNAVDATTAKVLALFPEIKVWLYGAPKDSAGKFVRSQIERIDLENPVHRPNLASLEKGMQERPNEPCYILQGHPNSWGKPEFAEFVRIIDFLKSINAHFTLPKELPVSVPAS